MRRVVISAFLTVICCGVSFGENSAQYGRCISEANTQMAMNACAREEVLRTEAELNDIYQKLLTAVGHQPTGVEKIKAAEGAWIAYRDAYTDAMYPAKGKQAAYGSIFPMEADLLRAKLTQVQIAALKDLLKQHSQAR